MAGSKTRQQHPVVARPIAATPKMAMLEHLDGIDWTKLSHAYGPATDVPGWLRDLASPASDEEALDALWLNLVHQGTIYDASVEAVPFLVELLQAEAIRNKRSVLYLLACVGSGSGFEDDLLNARDAVARGTALNAHILEASESELEWRQPMSLRHA